MVQPGPALREDAELRRRHAHRPAAFERVFERDRRLAPQAPGQGVEGLHTLHLVDGTDLQMILQAGADPRQVLLHFDAVPLEQGAGSDSRELEDLRRADGARAQDHFAGGSYRQRLAALHQFDADAAPRAVVRAGATVPLACPRRWP